MTPTRRREALQAMLAAVPLTPLDYLYRHWSQLSFDDRVWFLVKMLTREERQALALNFAGDLPWQFAQGQRVRWAGADGIGTVVQQRVTFRDVFGPVFSYLVEGPEGGYGWCYEADLTPTPEDTP